MGFLLVTLCASMGENPAGKPLGTVNPEEKHWEWKEN